jgi:hypothetical protein
MRFEVVVLLPQDTQDVVAAVTRVMDPYNVEHEVPPYKEYVEAEGVVRLAAAFRLPIPDPEAVAAEIIAQGDEAGVDDGGLYWITTCNPRGQWDGWMLHDQRDDVQPVLALPRGLQVYDVVTPDGVWHDFEYGWDWPEDRKADSRRRARELIESFPDYLAVMLDCHL